MLFTSLAGYAPQAGAEGFNPIIISPSKALVTTNGKATVVVGAFEGAEILLREGDDIVGTGMPEGDGYAVIPLTDLSEGVHYFRAEMIMHQEILIGETELPPIIVRGGEPLGIGELVQQYSGNTADFEVLTGLLRSIEPRFVPPPVVYDAVTGFEAGQTRIFSAMDGLYVQVSDSPIPAPAIGAARPSEAQPYESGSYIAEADPESFKYIGLYRIDESGHVAGYSNIVLHNKSFLYFAGYIPDVAGAFQLELSESSINPLLTKDDFMVSITDEYSTEIITEFTYDAIDQRIVLGDSTLQAYDDWVDVAIEASPTSLLLSGGSSEQVLFRVAGHVRENTEMYVSGARLDFRAESDQTGAIVATATTDENGYYSLDLEPGTYTVQLTKEGYMTDYVTQSFVHGSSSASPNDLWLMPPPDNGEIRIVLTWGAVPDDLDAHLTGPTPDGSSFHIFYDNDLYMFNDQLYVGLDFDDTDRYGPETMTMMSVTQEVYGTYSYFVHNYSEEAPLVESGATVKVYQGGSESPVKTYTIPVEGTVEHLYWDVLDIEIDENGNVTFVDQNTLSLNPPGEYLPAFETMSMPGGGSGKP